MILLKSLITLNEAISPPKEEYLKAMEKSEYKIVRVYMGKDGKVYIEDPKTYKIPIDVQDTKTHLALNYNNNQVDLYKGKLHGNKIDANTLQLIDTLKKKGVIDSSWKVRFSDEEGYYIDRKYSYKPGKYELLPANFWSRNSRIYLGENLELYHGTSDLELPTILKYGLRPLGMKHTVGGHETRLRTEYNKNFLYLAGTFTDAFRFASTKARSNMLRIDKDKYHYVEHYEWQQWFIKPVVLLVKLPDFTKLRSDDDRVISLIKQKGDELWDAMDDNQKSIEREKSAKWFRERGVNYKPEDIAHYLWTISDNGFSKAIEQIDKNEWKDWKASLESHNQVAYEGVIPPSYLEVIDLLKVSVKSGREGE